MQKRKEICQHCQKPHRTLYRVRTSLLSDWQFICPDCMPIVQQYTPRYQYGGTWQQANM